MRVDIEREIAQEKKVKVLKETLVQKKERIKNLARPLDAIVVDKKIDKYTKTLIYLKFNKDYPRLFEEVDKALQDHRDLLSVRFWTNALDACKDLQDLERAGRYWGQLKEVHGTPYPQHYNIMIAMLSEAGLVDEAKERFREMKASGRIPNAITYAQMFKVYANDSLDKLKELLSEMKGYNIPLDVTLYKSLLGALERLSEYDEAISIFTLMKTDLAIVPSRGCYNIMMRVYSKKGNPEKVKALFHEMRKHYVLPTMVTMVSQIKEAKSVQEVESLLTQTARVKIIPNDVYHSAVLRKYIELDHNQGALDYFNAIFNKKEEHQETLISLALKACLKLNKFEQGKELFEYALEKYKESPLVPTFYHFMELAIKNNQSGEFERLWEIARNRQIMLRPFHHSVLLQYFASLKNLEQVLVLANMAIKNNISLSKKALSVSTVLLNSSNHHQVSLKLLEQVHEGPKKTPKTNQLQN
uniref:PROP1-like PPR domain-containing protein n=1 Tax=Arcella intermedia TaxID=1963864 RepID=A0A6B2L397_9EUKA